MFGFHKMNAFTGMQFLASHHFYDMEKNDDVPLELKNYKSFLTQLTKKRVFNNCSVQRLE